MFIRYVVKNGLCNNEVIYKTTVVMFAKLKFCIIIFGFGTDCHNFMTDCTVEIVALHCLT